MNDDDQIQFHKNKMTDIKYNKTFLLFYDIMKIDVELFFDDE